MFWFFRNFSKISWFDYFEEEMKIFLFSIFQNLEVFREIIGSVVKQDDWLLFKSDWLVSGFSSVFIEIWKIRLSLFPARSVSKCPKINEAEKFSWPLHYRGRKWVLTTGMAHFWTSAVGGTVLIGLRTSWVTFESDGKS